MSQAGESFFTSVGCMDGRVQEPVLNFGKQKFGALFADTITEAGLVGLLGRQDVGVLSAGAEQSLLDSIKNKIQISLEKHHSKGIIVHGHGDCAGNPVEDEKHKDDVRRSVEILKSLSNSSVPVVGVFVKRGEDGWVAEEIPLTITA